jgi:hypothetical protein
MAIQIGLAQLGFPYHMTYAGLGLQTQTYIYQPSLGSSKIGTGPAQPKSTVPTLLCHSSLTDSQECVT